MLIQLDKLSLSGKTFVLLIVLLVYMFFVVDEELLVSIMSLIVLSWIYGLAVGLIDGLFMNSINEVVKQFSIYLFMNLILLRSMKKQVSDIVLVSRYKRAYNFVLNRGATRMSSYELYCINLVNYTSYIISSCLVELKIYFRSLDKVKSLKKLPVIVSVEKEESAQVSSDDKLRERFAVATSKLILGGILGKRTQ